MKKKLTTRNIRKAKFKTTNQTLQMLTCYDYQTACMLDQTSLDLILVGDSLGNVMLGYETTVEVTLSDMITFGAAVKRGAKNTFVVLDMPFGTYPSVDVGLENAIELFQQTRAEAIKLEGAAPFHLELIKRLTQIGIPVMGHIGLTPQSVHELGGYFMHGTNHTEAKRLINDANELAQAGVFSLVLECVFPEVSAEITKNLTIPTIGIGSGHGVDGQVLVINDLLHLGSKAPPKFCTPVANFFELKKDAIEAYIGRETQVDKESSATLLQ